MARSGVNPMALTQTGVGAARACRGCPRACRGACLTLSRVVAGRAGLVSQRGSLSGRPAAYCRRAGAVSAY